MSFDEEFLTDFFDEAVDTEALSYEFPDYVERYEVGPEINSGGMKKIHKCTDLYTDREVALAVVRDRSSQKVLRNFIKEARITAALEHPNIVPVHDTGFDKEGLPFFTMKLLNGENLQSVITQLAAGNEEYLQRYPIPRMLEIFLKICDAAAYAHSRNIVHLDLKPANIQIDSYGQVLLCDWGLARYLTDINEVKGNAETLPEVTHSIDLLIKGTPGYMAPEQISSEFGLRSVKTDIYSLGALLYEMLNFKQAVSGEKSDEIMQNTLKGDLEPSINLTAPLNAVVMKAMKLNQGERYNNVESLSEDIRAYTDGFATSAENAGFIKNTALLIKRHKAVSALIFIFLTVSVSLTTVFIEKLNKETLTALLSKEKAESSDKESLRLVSLLSNEKDQTLTMQKSAAEEFLKMAKFSYYRHGVFPRSNQLIHEVLKLNPDLTEAKFLYAKLQVGSFKINNAHKIISQLPVSSEQQLWLKLLAQFKDITNIEPDWRRVYDLRRAISNSGIPDAQHLFNHITVTFTRLADDDEKIAFAMKSFQEQCSGKFKGSFKKTVNGYEIDLSGNSDLSRIPELRKLPIISLNLSGTSVSQLNSLRKNSIERLNLSFTPVTDINALIRMPLKEIDLRGTTVRELDFLKECPLEKVLLGSHRANIEVLKEIPSLKEVIFPDHVYSRGEREQFSLTKKDSSLK